MNKTTEAISNFIERLQDKNFKLLDVTYTDPKTEENKEIFGTMNLVNNKSPITFIYGDNASGKSLIARLFESVVRSDKEANLSIRSVSIANRTSSGIEKAMIFGDEKEQSTGETSFKVARLGLNSLSKESKQGFVILDEPDIGLSSKYSRSLGKYVAKFLEENEENGKSLVVISHNDTFLESIIKHYNKPYNEVGVDTTLSLKEWLDDDSEFPLEDLELLPDVAISKWRGIQNFLNDRK